MADGDFLISEPVVNYEISDFERSAIEETKKLFTFDRHRFFFMRNGYSLNLQDSGLKKFPNCVRNLKHLIHIDFSYNNIDEFLEILTELHLLTIINLFGNYISEIPDWICDLENLQVLELGKNHIKEIPPEIGNLKKLDKIKRKNKKPI